MFLDHIWDLLKSGEFRPVPVRQVVIRRKTPSSASSGRPVVYYRPSRTGW
jgi:hypothetical protein